MKKINLTICLVFILTCAASAQTIPSYVPSSGLVGWWPFNGNTNDISGNNNYGTLSGANTPSLTADRFNNLNSAYSFTGVNATFSSNGGHMLLPDFSFNSWNQFTISIWVKELSTYNAGEDYISFGYTDNLGIDKPLICISRRGNNIIGTISDSGVTYTDNSAFLNLWKNFILTYNGTTANFYIDGVLVGSCNEILPNLPLGFNALARHWWNNGSSTSTRFNGDIDDIGIWNRNLTQQEITALYNSQTPCTKPAPVTLGVDKSTVRCPNDNVSVFVVTPSDPGLTYQWTRNGTNIPGATNSSITVSDIAKYKVFVRSGPGVDCQRVSGLIETTTATPPAVTAIAPNGSAYCLGDSVLLSASGATTGYNYQWKRYGVAIAGATSSSYYAKQTGNYRCDITNAGGCISTSNLISVTAGAGCRMMQAETGDIGVYPNPATSGFTVSFRDIGNEVPEKVLLINSNGQIIETKNISGKENILFHTSGVAPGAYHLQIMFSEGESTEKNITITK